MKLKCSSPLLCSENTLDGEYFTVCLSKTSDDSISAPISTQRKIKALTISLLAIHYGCAHGIIGNKRKQVWLRNAFNGIADGSPVSCIKRARRCRCRIKKKCKHDQNSLCTISISFEIIKTEILQLAFGYVR